MQEGTKLETKKSIQHRVFEYIMENDGIFISLSNPDGIISLLARHGFFGDKISPVDAFKDVVENLCKEDFEHFKKAFPDIPLHRQIED